MSIPKVSVIIPTYNRAYCVHEAIESVLKQTYKDYEIIVVDDGSTDNTSEVLAKFGNKIEVIRQENRGVSAARNAGIKAAKGEWIAFLDSDDLWLPEKLEVQINDIEKYPDAIAHMVDAKIIGYNNFNGTLFELRGLKSEFKKRPYRERPILDVIKTQFFTPAWVIKRDLIITKGIFFKLNFCPYEDYEFLLRFALNGPFAVNPYIGTIVRRKGRVNESLSHLHFKEKVNSLINICQIYENLIKRKELNDLERKVVERYLSGVRFEMSSILAHNDKVEEARKARWQSVKDNPCIKSILRAGFAEAGAEFLWNVFCKVLRREGGFRRSELDMAEDE